MKADLTIKPSLKDAMDLWRAGNDTGDGYAPDGSTDDMTPREAAEAAGMTAIEDVSDDDDTVLAWDVYTWVVVADCHGPWAVDVAVEEEVW